MISVKGNLVRLKVPKDSVFIGETVLLPETHFELGSAGRVVREVSDFGSHKEILIEITKGRPYKHVPQSSMRGRASSYRATNQDQQANIQQAQDTNSRRERPAEFDEELYFKYLDGDPVAVQTFEKKYIDARQDNNANAPNHAPNPSPPTLDYEALNNLSLEAAPDIAKSRLPMIRISEPVLPSNVGQQIASRERQVSIMQNLRVEQESIPYTIQTQEPPPVVAQTSPVDTRKGVAVNSLSYADALAKQQGIEHEESSMAYPRRRRSDYREDTRK